MDFFKFYSLPVSFSPDQVLVKKKYYELSKAYHPDFFVNESEDKQQEILELSTVNNQAYQTLSNPNNLLSYLLTLKGVLVDGEKYNLPQDFLMEMMEVNEAVMELEFDPNAEQLVATKKNIQEIEEGLDNELTLLSTDFEQAKDSAQSDMLQKMKDIWYRKKYLLRIRESINKFATRQQT